MRRGSGAGPKPGLIQVSAHADRRRTRRATWRANRESGSLRGIAEKLGELPQPVAHSLRVDVQAARRHPGVVRALQPREQRLGQPVGLLGACSPRSGASAWPLSSRASSTSASSTSGGQLLVAADDPVSSTWPAGLRCASESARRAQRSEALARASGTAGPTAARHPGVAVVRLGRHRPLAQAVLELPTPPGAVGIGHEQARRAAGEVDQHVGRQRRQRARA